MIHHYYCQKHYVYWLWVSFCRDTSAPKEKKKKARQADHYNPKFRYKSVTLILVESVLGLISDCSLHQYTITVVNTLILKMFDALMQTNRSWKLGSGIPLCSCFKFSLKVICKAHSWYNKIQKRKKHNTQNPNGNLYIRWTSLINTIFFNYINTVCLNLTCCCITHSAIVGGNLNISNGKQFYYLLLVSENLESALVLTTLDAQQLEQQVIRAL